MSLLHAGWAFPARRAAPGTLISDAQLSAVAILGTRSGSVGESKARFDIDLVAECDSRNAGRASAAAGLRDMWDRAR